MSVERTVVVMMLSIVVDFVLSVDLSIVLSNSVVRIIFNRFVFTDRLTMARTVLF